MLYGNTRLSLYRKGKEVKRIQKHNAITPFVQSAIREGNFNMAIPNSAIMPLTKWFDGCVLTDGANTPSVGMIAGTSNIVACAGNTPDSGSTDSRRGAFNTSESGDITGGRRFVWDWGTDRGNGSILSVGLTRSALALSEISKTGVPTANPINSVIVTDSGGGADSIGNLTIIDYEKSVGYLVTYSSGIVVTEYPLSTKTLKLLGTPFRKNIGYDGSPVATAHTIPDSTVTPTPNVGNTSVSYTGNHIHFIVWSGSTLKDYVVNTTSWELDTSYGTGGVITRTYSDVTFSNVRYNGSYNYHFHKDICPIIGDYVWCVGTVGGVPKMLKCNLLGITPTEVIEYDNLYKTVLGINDGQYINGCSVVLPNGDFIKTPSSASGETPWNSVLYYHNDEFYLAKSDFNFVDPSAYNTYGMCGINANSYGTIVDGSMKQNSSAMAHLGFIHGFVSTVNNLDEAVTKSADLTMKLTYEITES